MGAIKQATNPTKWVQIQALMERVRFHAEESSRCLKEALALTGAPNQTLTSLTQSELPTMPDVTSVLQNCTINGHIVYLPPQKLDRTTYTAVADKLKKIGGKWKGGNVGGFVFPHDPAELLAQIQNGESRNLKKEFQFFETPSALADYLVQLAGIEPAHDILEPSAGQGAIVKAINRLLPGKQVDCFELMEQNARILGEIPTVTLLGEDFLLAPDFLQYDRIIANPPFAQNQDIDHIRQMWGMLRPGGRLAAIASKHWQISSNKKETQFAQWLDSNGATLIDVPSGTFKQSGTNISAIIIILEK